MEEIKNEAVEAPQSEETTEVLPNIENDTIVPPEVSGGTLNESLAETTAYIITSQAEDGTIYDANSPAVLAFQARFPDSNETLEVQIASIAMMHNNIAQGKLPAGEGLETIIEAIKANIK